MGSFANSEIDALFEINYSWVSRRVETMKVRIHEDRAIKGPVATLKSQIKMWHPDIPWPQDHAAPQTL